MGGAREERGSVVKGKDFVGVKCFREKLSRENLYRFTKFRAL